MLVYEKQVLRNWHTKLRCVRHLDVQIAIGNPNCHQIYILGLDIPSFSSVMWIRIRIRIRIHLGPWIQRYKITDKMKGKAEVNQLIFFFAGTYIFQV